MNIRPKTVRRLSVLFAGLAIFAAGVAMLLVRSVQKEQATVASIRARAFADYARHDYPAAVKLFGTYINAGAAESTDAEAVFAYGMARSQVPMEGNRQIAEAVNLLQKYLDLAPADPHDAKHQLLMLYSRARYNKEARTLASDLLAKNPDDLDALRAETIAMINDRDFAAALPACRAVNRLDPTDIPWQNRELQLMSQTHEPAERIVAHARDLAAAHPGDPRLQIVLSLAFDLTGDASHAHQALEAAAGLPPPDAIAALRLLTTSPRWLRLWMNVASAAPNSDAASKWLNQLTPVIPSDAPAQRIALADAWERVGARFDASAAHDTARAILRPIIAAPNAPPDAWRAWAVANQLAGDLAEAERAWQKLADSQPNDPSARNNLAFVLLLQGADGDKLTHAESLAKEAIAADRNNGTFYDTLARIEAKLAKHDQAIANFRIAMQKNPNDVEAMIGLADELQSQPSGREEARALLGRINARLDAGTPLLQPIRKQLEHVKTSLSASIAPGE